MKLFFQLILFSLACEGLSQSSIGLLSVVEDGNNQIICTDEDFSFNVLGSTIMPSNLNLPGVNYNPGVGLALFSQMPSYTNNELLTDPNLLGIVLTQPDAVFLSPFVFDYNDILALIPPPLNTLSSPTTLYFQATTLYDYVIPLPYASVVGSPIDAAQSNVVSLTLHPSIQINLTQDCSNHSVEVNPIQNGMSGASYTVTNTYPASVVFPTNIINQTTTNISGFSGQNIPFGFDITSADGCMVTVQDIFIGETVASVTSVPAICEGDAAFSLIGFPAGGTWSGNPNVSANGVFDPSGISINLPTTYSCTYTPAVAAGGCLIPATTDVLVNPAANSQFIAPTEICINATPVFLQTTVTGGIWSSPSNSVNNQGVFNPTLAGPGIQTIIYILGGTCPTYTSHDILVHDLPVIKFDASAVQGCLPLSVDFTNTTNNAQSNYVWTINGSIESTGSPNFSYVFENSYCYNVGLSLTDTYGCSNQMDSIQLICPFPDPVVDFAYTPEKPSLADFEMVFSETLGGTAVNFWDFGDGQSTFDWAPAHYYDVVVPSEFEVCLTGFDGNGCEATVCKYIQLASGFEIFCPSAFTPGNDGVNDGFKPVIVSKKEVYKYRMMIFNRNGELIFETEEMQKAWYGNSFSGDQYVSDGTYNYIIEITLEGLSERQTYKGNVLIVR